MPERSHITREFLLSILDYDPETGTFTWKVPSGRWGRIPAGSPAGFRDPRGYVSIRINGAIHYAHRLAFLWMTGEVPDNVDHADMDKANNRWSNLRSANKSENGANRLAAANNTSGVRGVSWCSFTGRWRATIHKNGRTIRLGRYENKEDAERAYQDAAFKHFGEFAPFKR